MGKNDSTIHQGKYKGGKFLKKLVLCRWGVLQDNLNSIRSDEGLMLETPAFESLYGGQFTSSIQLIKPNYLEKYICMKLSWKFQ